jgi:hypothetical protein
MNGLPVRLTESSLCDLASPLTAQMTQLPTLTAAHTGASSTELTPLIAPIRIRIAPTKERSDRTDRRERRVVRSLSSLRGRGEPFQLFMPVEHDADLRSGGGFGPPSVPPQS